MVISSLISGRGISILPGFFTIGFVSSVSFCRGPHSGFISSGSLVVPLALADDGYMGGQCLRGGGHPLFKGFSPAVLRVWLVTPVVVGRSVGKSVAEPVLVATGFSWCATGIACFFQNDVPLLCRFEFIGSLISQKPYLTESDNHLWDCLKFILSG